MEPRAYPRVTMTQGRPENLAKPSSLQDCGNFVLCPFMDPEKKDWKEAFIELLEMVPLLGKPLGWIFKHLGITGLFSFLAGLLVTAVLVYLGKYPSAMISEEYKTPKSELVQKEQPKATPQEPKAASIQPQLVSLEGVVYDVFGNPLQGAVVVIPSSKRYSTTGKQGGYTLQDVPFQGQMNLEIIGGEGRIQVILDQNDMDGVKQIADTLIKNPLTSDLDPVLCIGVGEKEPIGKFDPIQADQYRISIENLEEDEASGLPWLYSFVTIFGPEDYELNKDLQLIYDWYSDGKLVRRFVQDDFKPKPYGWRSWARKKVWKGKWQLVIHTKYRVFEKINFTVV